MSIGGYRGTHLELTVPDLPVEGAGIDTRFTNCAEGNLKSWVAAIDAGEEGDAFYGYTGPAHRGVLDPRRRGHPPDDRGRTVPRLAAQGPRRERAILDSIRIEP